MWSLGLDVCAGRVLRLRAWTALALAAAKWRRRNSKARLGGRATATKPCFIPFRAGSGVRRHGLCLSCGLAGWQHMNRG